MSAGSAAERLMWAPGPVEPKLLFANERTFLHCTRTHTTST